MYCSFENVMYSRLSDDCDTHSGLDEMSSLSNMSMRVSPSSSDIPLSVRNEYNTLSEHFSRYTLVVQSSLQILFAKLDSSEILSIFLIYFCLLVSDGK